MSELRFHLVEIGDDESPKKMTSYDSLISAIQDFQQADDGGVHSPKAQVLVAFSGKIRNQGKALTMVLGKYLRDVEGRRLD